MKKILTLMAVFVILGLALAACGGGSGAATEFTIIMTEFQFDPSQITVPAGASITVNLDNQGTLDHNWVVLESGYRVQTSFTEGDQDHVFFEHQQTPAGQTVSVSFNAPSQPGDYQIVCSVPGHFESGMEGILTVAP